MRLLIIVFLSILISFSNALGVPKNAKDFYADCSSPDKNYRKLTLVDTDGDGCWDFGRKFDCSGNPPVEINITDNNCTLVASDYGDTFDVVSGDLGTDDWIIHIPDSEGNPFVSMTSTSESGIAIMDLLPIQSIIESNTTPLDFSMIPTNEFYNVKADIRGAHFMDLQNSRDIFLIETGDISDVEVLIIDTDGNLIEKFEQTDKIDNKYYQFETKGDNIKKSGKYYYEIFKAGKLIDSNDFRITLPNDSGEPINVQDLLNGTVDLKGK